jgi:MFS family permease
MLSTDSTLSRVRPYAWFVVAMLMMTTVISYSDRQVLSLLVDPIRKDLGASDREMSYLLGGAFAIAYGLAGLPMGYLADRFSRRNMIIGGVIVWSLATIACGLAQSYEGLFAARLIVGIGEAVLTPAALSLVADYFPPERRGAGIGIYFTGISLSYGGAMVIGGIILQAIASHALPASMFHGMASWRSVLLLIGVPSLFWCVALLLIREPQRQLAAPLGAADIGSALPKARFWILTIPLYFVIASASMIDNAVGAWAPSLLIREFHMPAAQVGQVLGIPLMIGFAGGQFLGGFLADFVGRRKAMRGQLILSLVLALLILPLSQIAGKSMNLSVVLLGITSYFFLAGNVISILFSIMVNAMPPRHRAFAISVALFLNVAVGASIGPVIVTFAAERMAGLGGAIALTTSFGAVLMSAGIMLMLFLIRHHAAPGEAQKAGQDVLECS